MKNLKIGVKIWLLVLTISLFAIISIIAGRQAISIVKDEALVQVDEVMNQAYQEQLKSLIDSTALAMGAAISGQTDQEQILKTLP